MRLSPFIALCCVAATVAGCSKDDDGKAGRATGAGFSFPLPGGWSSDGDPDSLGRDLAESSGGRIDADGFLVAGRWHDPGDSDARSTVNVVLEPVTRDTPFAAIAASSDKLLGSSARRSAGPSRLGGEPAATTAYTRKGRDARLVLARHGGYSYAVTVQADRGHTGDLDRLVRRVAAGWRFRPFGADDRRLLARTAVASGSNWRTRLPPGWRATGAATLRKSGNTGAESLWRGHIAQFTTNVTVSKIDAPADDAVSLLGSLERNERKTFESASNLTLRSIRRGSTRSIDGERAGDVTIRSSGNGLELRQREVIVVHDGELFRITLSAEADRFRKDDAAFDRSLDRWRWR